MVVHICDYMAQPIWQNIRISIGLAPFARTQAGDDSSFTCVVKGDIAKIWQPGFAGREAVDSGGSYTHVESAVIRLVVLLHGRGHHLSGQLLHMSNVSRVAALIYRFSCKEVDSRHIRTAAGARLAK